MLLQTANAEVTNDVRPQTEAPATIHTLCAVIPCYNESKALPITSVVFLNKIEQLINERLISDDSVILFVDDGSTDGTWKIIEQLSSANRHFRGLKLSRNRGHQNALLAGLDEARSIADVSVSLDCDGQDDVNAIDEMLERYYGGYEIVYGVRNDRATDSRFKRLTAEWFYKGMAALGAEVVFNHADYRLMSKRAIDALFEFSEVNLFLRGLVPLVGFESCVVEYSRAERVAGESHYPLKKMLALAMNGITSLSVRPIRMISFVGCAISVLSLIGICWVLALWISGNTVSGWASLIIVALFLGGIQLIALGIIGEYIGKIYLETKRRPRYIIEKRTSADAGGQTTE